MKAGPWVHAYWGSAITTSVVLSEHRQGIEDVISCDTLSEVVALIVETLLCELSEGEYDQAAISLDEVVTKWIVDNRDDLAVMRMSMDPADVRPLLLTIRKNILAEELKGPA